MTTNEEALRLSEEQFNFDVAAEHSPKPGSKEEAK